MKKKSIALIIALVMIVGLAACGAGDSGSAPVAPTPGATAPQAPDGGELRVIRLGGMAPLTGVQSEFGIGFDATWQMAIEDINARGGTSNGFTFEITVRDDRAEPMEGVDIARQFADDPNIMAILGSFTSGVSMAAAPIADEAGITLLSPTASSPLFAPMSPFAFSIVGLQSDESYFAAEQIIQRYLGMTDVAVIWVNSDWGLAAITHFVDKAEEIGLNIVANTNYLPTDIDFSSQITEMRAANPEVVLIMDQGGVPLIINQIRGVGWDVPITAVAVGASNQLLELTGENGEGVIVPSPFFIDPDDEFMVDWAERFRARTGWVPSYHPANGYDSMMLIARAVEMIGDGEVTRQAIRDNLALINETVGVTGHISFEPEGNIIRDYMILTVRDGQWVILEYFGFADR